MPASQSTTLAAATPPTWWRSPQRLWLRRAIFQVHLWLGVALALYCTVIGISGSALVFRAELENFLAGGRLNLQSQSAQPNFDRSIRRIEADRPGWSAVGLEGLQLDGRAPTLLLQKTTGPSTTNDRQVSFDPDTGAVLSDHLRYDGVLGWLANLHYYLLAGEPGLFVSGWLALGLLILCLTGAVLWWPGVSRWSSALVLRRRASWQRFNFDLHTVVGFWCAGLLAVVAFTGLYFAFPSTVRDLVILLTGHSPPAEQKSPIAEQPPLRVSPPLTVDAALAAARKALPLDAPPGYLQLPQPRGGSFSVTGYYTHTAPYSQLVEVTLDNNGRILALTDTRKAVLGMRIIQYFFAIHFGSFGGPGPLGILVKVLWVLLGMAPALLSFTGLLMYWNRKLRPLWVRLTRN